MPIRRRAMTSILKRNTVVFRPPGKLVECIGQSVPLPGAEFSSTSSAAEKRVCPAASAALSPRLGKPCGLGQPCRSGLGRQAPMRRPPAGPANRPVDLIAVCRITRLTDLCLPIAARSQGA